ncbi:AlpA family phage regulatory protein [Rubellimicrobium rubrum]|uniref:AlpA family phage regulatory protein n=1 Tax=Rubellimicrobium rubrum TaxID=2585369 RepID=A0A5C4MJY7_9RHOB|nr:AlpA family phage regulatory protein [Rubellimicrobium rubrum]TNC45938.1 AlpA family phage regulatory protein [Rubellimicrobium rubrum]
MIDSALIPKRLLRRQAVEDLTGLSRSSIYKQMSEGTFPHAVRISARAVAWDEARVLAWLASRPSTQA